METACSRFRKERFLCKIKEGKDFRGVVLVYVAQGNPQPDAEIAEKRLFWTGTSPAFSPVIYCRRRSADTPPGNGVIPERGPTCNIFLNSPNHRSPNHASFDARATRFVSTSLAAENR